jgi:peptide deformylase
MAIRKIAQLGEPVLRRRADEVGVAQLLESRMQTLIDDMIETMRDADGAGLAAPQVYEPWRLCVMEIEHNPRYPEAPKLPLTVMVNPVVTPLVPNPEHPSDGDSILMYEGCLSVQGIRGRVRRPRKVRVSGLDRHGKATELVLEGVLAAVIQHETDHLDGRLFVDRADPSTLTFLREYERHVPPNARVIDGSAK